MSWCQTYSTGWPKTWSTTWYVSLSQLVPGNTITPNFMRPPERTSSPSDPLILPQSGGGRHNSGGPTRLFSRGWFTAHGRGRIHAMRTTIDAAGRFGDPSRGATRAGLRPGMELEVRWRDGRIEIEPAVLPLQLVRKGRLLVAVPAADVEPLTTQAEEATRQTLTSERDPSV